MYVWSIIFHEVGRFYSNFTPSKLVKIVVFVKKKYIFYNYRMLWIKNIKNWFTSREIWIFVIKPTKLVPFDLKRPDKKPNYIIRLKIWPKGHTKEPSLFVSRLLRSIHTSYLVMFSHFGKQLWLFSTREDTFLLYF